jgi:two-component system response regulator NreC
MHSASNSSIPTRLIIADDHAIVREGLVSLLEGEADLTVVGQAGTGKEALSLARQHRPDLALLDITMPDMNGLEATRQIKQEQPDVEVLILTMHEEEAFFFEALRAGAAGYVLKGAHGDELLTAIRAVRQGGIHLSPNLAGELVRDYLDHQPDPSSDNPLTPREQEVLTLIAKGYSNSEIAELLTLSVNTIKTHRSRIYDKLDLHDRAALVSYAIRRGLLRS